MECQNDKYRIKSDSYQWGFYEFVRNDKHGNPVWENWGYWPTIELMLDRVVERIYRESDAISEAEINIRSYVRALAREIGKHQADLKAELLKAEIAAGVPALEAALEEMNRA